MMSILQGSNGVLSPMMRWILGALLMANFACFDLKAMPENGVNWSDLGHLNADLIERKAREYILSKMPELKGVEVKWVQTTADYSKRQGPSLDIAFLHENSFKPIAQNQTLGPISEHSGIKYYMEFVFVEFSQEGKPVNLRFREALLTKDLESSKAAFLEAYESF